MSLKYSEHMKKIEELMKRLQSCEDVDDALELFETASVHIKHCEDKIQAAEGRFQKLLESDSPNQ